MVISAEAAGPPGARRTVFVDFEASSLAKGSYPIEVAWVFEDGSSESHLIRPAPAWTDWAESAERIHGIPRDTLFAEGLPHEEVARRMVNRLTGHALYVTAPSWDGQWLSKLLRAASLPRHALRVEDTTLAHARVVRAVFAAAGWDEAAGREAGQAIFATIPAEAGRAARPSRPGRCAERARAVAPLPAKRPLLWPSGPRRTPSPARGGWIGIMRSAGRSDQRLATMLAALAGYVDAIGFMATGGFFVSFMSGQRARAVAPLPASGPCCGRAAARAGRPARLAAGWIGIMRSAGRSDQRLATWSVGESGYGLSSPPSRAMSMPSASWPRAAFSSPS